MLARDRFILLFSMLTVLSAAPRSSIAAWVNIDGNPIDAIVGDALNAPITALNEELIAESERLINESRMSSTAWETKYFEIVADLHDANERKQRYISSITRIKHLEELIDQLDINLQSIREIYGNRLKAIPTAYLVMSQYTADIETKSRQKIDNELSDLTKSFLADSFIPTFITSYTKVRNYRVVLDIIKASESGRIESFETDPVRQMSETRGRLTDSQIDDIVRKALQEE